MDKLEPMYITGVNVKQYTCFGKQLDVPQNAIPQKCQNEPKTCTQTNICTQMFIVALFTIAKRRK